MDLTGRVGIVTGAARGSGKPVSDALFVTGRR